MSTLWVLTANRGFAKIFEVKGRGHDIKEIHHIDNPDGLKRDREVHSDRPGRAFDRVGGGRHAFSNEVDYHSQEQKQFIQKLSTILQQGYDSKAYEQLAFVAPARFLGGLNQGISSTVKKAIIQEVDSDLPEHLSERERIDHICKYLDLWNHKK